MLERDAVVGAKRVCAAGLRPGFCGEFDLPRAIVHLDTPRLTLSTVKKTYAFTLGPAHTTTREELDGTIAALAQREGAEIRTSTLFRSLERDGDGVIVEYADTKAGTRKKIRAKSVFLAQGSSARLDDVDPAFAYSEWRSNLLTCIQYRVYPQTPAIAETYQTLEMHYYRSPLSGETLIAWMFPKRDHLSIGLGHGSEGQRCGAARGTRLVSCRACKRACFPASRIRFAKKAICSTAASRVRASPTIA